MSADYDPLRLQVEVNKMVSEFRGKPSAIAEIAVKANWMLEQDLADHKKEKLILQKRAEAAEARAERLENELSEVVAYGGYYADIENRLPPDGQVVKVIASSTHGVDDFTVLRMNEKWYFASDPPREIPGEFEVIRIKPWDVKRFGASYDEEF